MKRNMYRTLYVYVTYLKHLIKFFVQYYAFTIPANIHDKIIAVVIFIIHCSFIRIVILNHSVQIKQSNAYYEVCDILKKKNVLQKKANLCYRKHHIVYMCNFIQIKIQFYMARYLFRNIFNSKIPLSITILLHMYTDSFCPVCRNGVSHRASNAVQHFTLSFDLKFPCKDKI